MYGRYISSFLFFHFHLGMTCPAATSCSGTNGQESLRNKGNMIQSCRLNYG